MITKQGLKSCQTRPKSFNLPGHHFLTNTTTLNPVCNRLKSIEEQVTWRKYPVSGVPSRFRVGASAIENFSPSFRGYISEFISRCMNMSNFSLFASIRVTVGQIVKKYVINMLKSFFNTYFTWSYNIPDDILTDWKETSKKLINKEWMRFKGLRSTSPTAIRKLKNGTMILQIYNNKTATVC